MWSSCRPFLGAFVHPELDGTSPFIWVKTADEILAKTPWPRLGQLPCAMLQIVQYCVRSRRGCSRTVRIAKAMSSGLR